MLIQYGKQKQSFASHLVLPIRNEVPRAYGVIGAVRHVADRQVSLSTVLKQRRRRVRLGRKEMQLTARHPTNGVLAPRTQWLDRS